MSVRVFYGREQISWGWLLAYGGVDNVGVVVGRMCQY